MESNDYIKQATKTESQDSEGIKQRLCQNHRLLHAAIGASTEAAELTDQLKKLVAILIGRIYSKKQETFSGILLYWPMSLGLASKKRWNKLKARYGDKFTTEKAINRDLDKESESPAVSSPKDTSRAQV